MRILHTSDWHLGQNFFTKSRKLEHQQFIAWLLQLVQSQNIDAIIIAGDVFDTGSPPSYAREMYNQFVVNLSQLNCQLVVLGGNHDSVSTLNESKQLLACLNTHVIANTSDNLSEQLIELKDEHHQIGALLCAVPFVRARDVVVSQSGASGTDKQKVLGQAIESHYHQLFEFAVEQRSVKQIDVPIITTGHLTALGVTASDSVRDIYIGTLDGFDAKGFPPADYIALGHIHRPQLVAKKEHIRYSGSPIPLSFDELKSQKQVVIVEFDASHNAQVSTIEVPMFQAMSMLKGNLVQIETQLDDLTSTAENASIWLSIEVEEQDYLSDLQARVQSMVEGKPFEVLQLRRARGPKQASLTQEKSETLAELTPFDVFGKRIELETFEGEEEQERLVRMKDKFRQIVSEVEHKEAD